MIIQEEEDDLMSNKKVHASTGKRKSTVKTEQDSIVKLEHTFGDDGSLSMGMLNNADDSRRSESKKVESSIPWNSKADISLSTDSIFNLQDEEMRQFLKDDSNRKIIHGSNSKQLKHRSLEVNQMLNFISEIEEVWLSLIESK